MSLKRKGPALGGAFSTAFCRSRSDRDDVRSLRALGAVGHFELDLLALGQALEARTGQRAEMHEYILAAVILRDKAEALRIVEPFHCASGSSHYFFTLSIGV